MACVLCVRSAKPAHFFVGRMAQVYMMGAALTPRELDLLHAGKVCMHGMLCNIDCTCFVFLDDHLSVRALDRGVRGDGRCVTRENERTHERIGVNWHQK